MAIDDNKEAKAMMKKALGSMENRIREAYNKGYHDGLKEGVNQATKKLVASIINEVDIYACDTCKHEWESWDCESCDPCTKADSNYELKKPTHGYMWICPSCGLVTHSDYSECHRCGWKKDEPQTEVVNDSPILVKDLVDDEFNPYDEECMRCKHLKLQCEFVPSYCNYEPRDENHSGEATEMVEPQTERSE